MAKIRTKFVCQNCAYESPKWMGRCPGCGEWNTLVEESEETRTAVTRSARASNKPQSLSEVKMGQYTRIDTRINEFNRVLGGGLVPGSLVLVGGDPGIGKSTIVLQVATHLANQGLKVLYVSGEESAEQLRMRAERLGDLEDSLLVLAENNLDQVEVSIDLEKPDCLIIDSIQTVHSSQVTSAPGSVSQVRECTNRLMQIAKGRRIPTFIIGHVTKQGSIAGPRVLEHMVDTVLYFEGDRYNSYRILRAVKNRFGSTNEIGMFEMRTEGLVEVENASEFLLSERPEHASGSVVVPSIEGTRPMLVEIQALLSQTAFGNPRRVVNGMDQSRILLQLAVLEKHLGMQTQIFDAYLNLAGGISVKEPALDLGIAAAIASSLRDKPIDPRMAVMGEIGLTGEIRSVQFVEKRILEAEKIGFSKVVLPESNLSQLKASSFSIQLIGVKTIREAIDVIFE